MTGNLFFTIRLLWGALLMSIVMYAFIAFGVFDAEPREADATVLWFTVGGAFVAFVLSFALPRYLLKSGVASLEPEIVEEIDSSQESVFRGAPKTRRVFKDPTKVMQRMTQVIYTPLILRFALSQALAVFGIVTASMGYPKPISGAFIAAGFVRLLFAIPTIKDDIIKPIEEHYDATFNAMRVGLSEAEAS